MKGHASQTSQMSIVRLAALTVTLAACGGGGGGAPPIVIPSVPAGAFEAGCQQLCTLAPGETICTAKHAEYCLAHCRASTRDLPTACGDCLIAAGTPIAGYTDSSGSYCAVGGAASLASCKADCDDAGAAGPSPDLEVICQLECTFYMHQHVPAICSADGSAGCLADCRSAIATRGRVCAQCFAEQTGYSAFCLNDECDCETSFTTTGFGCETLCDTLPPT